MHDKENLLHHLHTKSKYDETLNTLEYKNKIRRTCKLLNIKPDLNPF